jgi:hypothetical protein
LRAPQQRGILLEIAIVAAVAMKQSDTIPDNAIPHRKKLANLSAILM